ncbi:MAG: response regulator [Candidatus Hydrogenedentes bacterium]|nr:response regulator [Candidatus Hydrogenedentota bacterium]
MQGRTPRRGIEWKILTSILSVSILPLLVALMIGLYIAREGQGSAVRQALLTAAQRTASGLRISANDRLDPIRVLAENPRIVAALTPGAQNRPTVLDSPLVLEDISQLLKVHTGVDTPNRMSPVFSLLDAEGNVVTTTNPDVMADPSLGNQWIAYGTKRPDYVDMDRLTNRSIYFVHAVAPVRSLQYKEVIGYVSVVFDIDVMLKYAFGYDPERNRVPSKTDVYHIAYEVGDGTMISARLDPDSPPNDPRLITQPLDRRLAAFLLDPQRPSSDSVRTFDFSPEGVAVRSFVAYDRLFDSRPVYVIVSRPASIVYSTIYLWAILAIAGCLAFIAFLGLNAYRNVHNNIVRPVLLLNEGAQIIGQGDLELKLKIGTGDEIEELASSFNKMALALKGNIRRLEESEERYRGLVTSMRDGIVQTDSQGVIAFLNPAGLEIFGFPALADVMGQNLNTLFIDEGDFITFAEQLQRRGFVERTRVWMRRSDGRSICVELSGNLVHDDEGGEVGLEGIFRDITKSVRLEREAQDRAERLSAINQIANVINSSLEAGRLYESLVVEVKKLVDFDYAELALLDDKSESFAAQRLWPVQDAAPSREYPVEDERYCSAWVAHRQECLVVDDLNAPNCQFSGQFPESTHSCLAVPLYATGRIIGTLNLGANRANAFTHHDVEVLEQMAPHVAVAIRNAQLLENLQVSLEEVTRAREKLYLANEEMKTLDEMKTNLLSNVSHELRTPLVSVMGYTDMILNGKAGPINDTQREYLGISLRNIEKLVTLIENLLDFSRLHRGKETLVFDTFDLVDCARSSMQIIQPVADGRDIRLELRAPETPVLVEGEKGKIGQIFNNLLSNAVKFNHQGGQVTIAITPGESAVDVQVSDTGIGIPQEALDKVFTRFYQYDASSTRKYGGTGIGLSIAQDIARLHGSRITVTSEVGKGTTFRFSMPLLRPKKESGAEEEGLPAETRLLVEIVTVDRALATQVRNMLLSEGMDVVHAGTTKHAMALATKHSPDCILVDVDTNGNATALLDTLLADKVSSDRPLILVTNDDELYARYKPKVACRLKRSLRKSILLSGIHHALSENVPHTHRIGRKILCVDDDPEVLVFISRCLESEGYEVVCCRSGEDALGIVDSGEFALVLLDIAMPGMDGWEACKRIRGNPSLEGIKIFMVTAKPLESESYPRPQDRGADGYILKPFHAGDLLELVQGLPIPHPVKQAQALD